LYVIPPSYLVGELLSDKALSTVWRMNKQVAEVVGLNFRNFTLQRERLNE
jgi:hypothetical protein